MATGDAAQAVLARRYIVCKGKPYRPDTVKVNGSVYIREDLITNNQKGDDNV